MIELILVPICFFMDQLTKRKALEKYTDNSKKIYDGLINLKIVYNEGAFMGLLRHNKLLLMIFNIFALIITIFMGIYLFFEKGNHLLKVAISLILGGALGNVYDRIKRGKVVDFFSFKFKANIYYNLADMFIFIGTIIFAIASLIKGK